MAKEEDEEKDLGFFNNIKAELLPLIAGLVSFNVLADKAINQLGEYFGLDIHGSALLFIWLYFVMPVMFIVCWLCFINYKEGLKKELLTVKSKERTIVLALLILLTLSALGMPWFDAITSLILSSIVLAIILFYAWLLLKRKFKNYRQYHREYRQAKYQYIVVILLFITVWGFYYRSQLSDEDRHGKEKQKQEVIHLAFSECQLQAALDSAIKHRKKDEDNNEKIEWLDSCFQAYQYSHQPDAALKSIHEKHSQFLLINEKDSIKSKWITEQRFSKLKYAIDQQRKSDLETAKSMWAHWLRLVQFKGLLLFVCTILFLLSVWYHAYTSKLANSKEREDEHKKELYSEITISRIAIYVLFLLIIIFFKPIDAEDVNFDKPFITSNPISLTDSRQYHGTGSNTDKTEPNNIEPTIIEIEKLVHVIDTLKLRSLQDSVKRLKKQANKPVTPYDTDKIDGN